MHRLLMKQIIPESDLQGIPALLKVPGSAFL